MNVEAQQTWARIRGACCSFHGLPLERGYRLDDPRPLDAHAASIVTDVMRAKRYGRKAA